MKLLFILPEFYPQEAGGIIRFYKELLPALSAKGCSVKVLVGSAYTRQDYHTDWKGIEVSYLSPSLFDKYADQFSRYEMLPLVRKSLASAWAMYEQANKGEGYDLVECTDFGLGFIPWVTEQNKPVLVRMHGSTGQINYHDPIPSENLEADFIRQLELTLLPYASAIETHSKVNAVFWSRLLKRDVGLVYPVMETAAEPPLLLPERLPGALVAARLQYWKGPLILASALERNTDIHVDWYGRDMPYQHTGKKMSAHLAVKFPGIWQRSFRYHQAKDMEEMEVLQSKTKFGIIPSLWDMFNMTAIELMAKGTPVVCSDGAGVSDLIKDGYNGFTFSSGDALMLSEKLQKMNNLSEHDYEKMCERAKETVREQLSAEHNLPRYIESYNKTITDFQPGVLPEFLRVSSAYDRQESTLNEQLDQLPLKKLAAYIFKRTMKKI